MARCQTTRPTAACRRAHRFDPDVPMLLALAPSLVTRLHGSIALRYASGPRAAMAELDTLAGALELTANPAEQAVLQHRITWT